MAARHIPALQVGPTKRLIALGVAITLAYSAICMGFLWDAGRRDHEQARVVAANLIASIQSEISRNIELYDLSLQAVADGLQLPELERVDPVLRQIILFDRSATARDLGLIFVLSEQGDVAIESRTIFPRKSNFAERAYFQFHKNNTALDYYIGSPTVTKRGEYILPISRRLNKHDGSFNGVVVGNMSLAYFHRLFKNVTLGPGDALTLLRSDGTVLMRAPFNLDVIGRDFSKSDIFQKLSSAPFGSFDEISLLDATKRLYVHQQVDKNPLVIVAGLSHQTIYAEWRRTAWVVGSLNLGLCLVTMSLVVFLAGALKRRTIAEHDRAAMASTDGLTGICNRRRFDEIFELEWRRALRGQTPVTLLMIDTDFFKAFNDTHGHQAGDAALVALAKCIADGAHRASDLVARYGGEEFIVLLPGESLEGAFSFAEKIRTVVRSLQFQWDGVQYTSPTVSIGIASTVPQHGAPRADLLKAADNALYKAKEQGRNCCVLASQVESRIGSKLAA